MNNSYNRQAITIAIGLCMLFIYAIGLTCMLHYFLVKLKAIFHLFRPLCNVERINRKTLLQFLVFIYISKVQIEYMYILKHVIKVLLSPQ